MRLAPLQKIKGQLTTIKSPPTSLTKQTNKTQKKLGSQVFFNLLFLVLYLLITFLNCMFHQANLHDETSTTTYVKLDLFLSSYDYWSACSNFLI